jgi:membrane protein implicated in regulation of membrane protease activity
MLWPMLALTLAFCGIAVLAVLSARVYAEVRRLARQVSDSSARITRAAEDLERATEPLSAQVGAVHRDGNGA